MTKDGNRRVVVVVVVLSSCALSMYATNVVRMFQSNYDHHGVLSRSVKLETNITSYSNVTTRARLDTRLFSAPRVPRITTLGHLTQRFGNREWTRRSSMTLL